MFTLELLVRCEIQVACVLLGPVIDSGDELLLEPDLVEGNQISRTLLKLLIEKEQLDFLAVYHFLCALDKGLQEPFLAGHVCYFFDKCFDSEDLADINSYIVVHFVPGLDLRCTYKTCVPADRYRLRRGSLR